MAAAIFVILEDYNRYNRNPVNNITLYYTLFILALRTLIPEKNHLQLSCKWLLYVARLGLEPRLF